MSALEQLVANMTVAQLAEAAGLTVDEVVALVLRRGRARGEAGDDEARRARAPEPLLPRAGEILVDPAVTGTRAVGRAGSRAASRSGGRRRTKGKPRR